MSFKILQISGHLASSDRLKLQLINDSCLAACSEIRLAHTCTNSVRLGSGCSWHEDQRGERDLDPGYARTALRCVSARFLFVLDAGLYCVAHLLACVLSIYLLPVSIDFESFI